jgi:hypothetical protein
MSQLQVIFRGLFAVVRHIPMPPASELPSPDPEHMTVVFVKDPESMTEHSHPGGHRPVLFVHNAVLAHDGGDNLRATLDAIRLPDHDQIKDYTPFDLSGWHVTIPQGDVLRPVRHDPDELPGNSEPTGDDGEKVLPHRFRPLSRLPNLNQLTGGQFNENNLRPFPPNVNARVRLSGGQLCGMMSYKALRSTFFEFFAGDGPEAIQPAVEDVEFVTELSDDIVRLGLRRLASEPETPGITIELVSQLSRDIPSFMFQSFPLTPMDTATSPDQRPNLNHFLTFYDLMTGKTEPSKRHGRKSAEVPPSLPKQPVVRVLGRFDRGQLVHTTPDLKDMCRPTFPIPEPIDPAVREKNPTFTTTQGQCSCLAASAFCEATGD